MLNKLMETLFGCHHHGMSRVFTMKHRSYRVCYDCGSEFNYSLANMKVAEQPVTQPTLNHAMGAADVWQMPSRLLVAEVRPAKLGRARA